MPDVPLIPDREADDVAATRANARLWLAWTRARLDSETAVFAAADGGVVATPQPVGGAPRSCRADIAPLGDGVVVVACAGRSVVGSLVDGKRAPRHLRVDAHGAVHQVALAGGGARAWIAWDERRGPDALVRVGRLDGAGSIEAVPMDLPSGRFRRSPALASDGDIAWLAWIEGPRRGPGRVFIARLDGSAMGDAIELEGEPAPHEAPAVAAAAGGCVLAWHGPVRGHADADVTRWLHVAAVDAQRVRAFHPPAPVLDRASAGFDQGWEFPAISVDGDDVWIAGRSSHGFHAAVRRAGAWSERISLSNDEWGGRGRCSSLVPLGDTMYAIRREPDGIAVSPLAAPDTPAPARRRTTGPPPLAGAATLAAAPDGVLFGDLHQHTALSDGCGTPDELYVAARDVRRLDFAAVTDHDRFCGRAIGPLTWSTLCDVADAYDEPGRFVTFRAFEFTGARLPGPGHKCVYFGNRAPDRIPDKNVDALFAALREYGGIAVPHHVGWTGTGAEHHDSELQPVWEIMSVHGCYECSGVITRFPPRDDVVLPGQFICDALAGGLRFGFIGSSDSHGLLWHHGVGQKRNPFEQGVAAVVGAELDRESILAALRARRCYATTGARISMRLDLDGAALGSELPQRTAGSLRIEVTGTGPLARVDLVTSAGEQPVDGLDGARCAATVAIVPRHDAPADFAYVRVVQIDGETAWSSPYWFVP